MEKNGTPASPETAFASSVFPVPGEPTNRTPFGIRAPSDVNFCGSFKNSTTSASSALDSSIPATSAKVTVGRSPFSILAWDLPKLMAPAPPPCCLKKTSIKTPNRMIGRKEINKERAVSHGEGCFTSIVMFFDARSEASTPRIESCSNSVAFGSI